MIESNKRYITSTLNRRGHACTILLGLALVIQLVSIFTSPSDVPLHWGVDGEADAYGSPWLTLIACESLITISDELEPHFFVNTDSASP